MVTDGKRLVCAAAPEIGDLDLYVVVVDTGRVARLPSGPTSDLDPAWSRDGRTVADIRRGPTAMIGVLQVGRADGSGRRTLL